MSSTQLPHEAAVLQAMLPQLEADGYAVFLQPSKAMLPPFMAPYRPDAIAVKGDSKLLIEIVPSAAPAHDKLDRLRNLVAGHAGWELRLIYAPPRTERDTIPPLSPGRIMDALDRVPVAFADIGPAAALLVAWSAFEAAARSLLPSELAAPQSPRQLVELLAADGHITPDEADTLRRLVRLRNEAAHGQLDIGLDRADLQKLIDTTKVVLSLQKHDA